jgi:hypothetical protein
MDIDNASDADYHQSLYTNQSVMEGATMSDGGCNLKKYTVITALGAVSGGVLVAMASRAIPRLMAGMMRNMMTMMAKEGCSPEEM